MEETIILDNKLIVEIEESQEGYEFHSSIESELLASEAEITQINEDLESLNRLDARCDQLDYSLAVTSGAVCGIIDIFLVGSPENSFLSPLTDRWFESRVMDFARLNHWDGDNIKSAVRFLEKSFKVNYDQRGAGDAGSVVYDLTPSNHHFKSLGHNPSLLGLFYSVLDQFKNTSTFVSGSDLISLNEVDGGFELIGGDFTSKIFAGIKNWIGHLMSDVTGSSSSQGRGMGIPSPLLTWTNDIIAIKRKLRINASEFDQAINEVTLQIYQKGFDVRFQTSQTIPVVINELLTRLFYSIRRTIKYFQLNDSSQWNFNELWKACDPYSNASVGRMLTVSHATFELIDISDAVIRSYGTNNPIEFIVRLNLIGVGRLSVSIYGEVGYLIDREYRKRETDYHTNRRVLIESYIEDLKKLSKP